MLSQPRGCYSEGALRLGGTWLFWLTRGVGYFSYDFYASALRKFFKVSSMALGICVGIWVQQCMKIQIPSYAQKHLL